MVHRDRFAITVETFWACDVETGTVLSKGNIGGEPQSALLESVAFLLKQSIASNLN